MKQQILIACLVPALYVSQSGLCTAAEPTAAALKNLGVVQESKSCRKCDLQNLNHNKLDLSKADLEEANLSGSTFYLTNLAGANLRYTNLAGASFGGADLAEADLRGAKVTGTTFNGAFMEGAKFDAGILPVEEKKTAKPETRAQNKSATPLTMGTNSAVVQELDQNPSAKVDIPTDKNAGKNASQSVPANAAVAKGAAKDDEKTGVSEKNAKTSAIETLTSTKKCYGCDLSGADLTGKNLAGADLEQANLSQSILKNVSLKKANLRGADLTGANLQEANLTKADLYKANLSKADLTKADTDRASFEEAILQGTIGLEVQGDKKK